MYVLAANDPVLIVVLLVVATALAQVVPLAWFFHMRAFLPRLFVRNDRCLDGGRAGLFRIVRFRRRFQSSSRGLLGRRRGWVLDHRQLHWHGRRRAARVEFGAPA